MNLRPLGAWVILVFAVAVGACRCGSVGAGQPCQSSADCASGLVCLQGTCLLPDGGLPDGGTPQGLTLAFDPPSATLVLDGVSPQTATFTLMATQPNGSPQAVPAETATFNRPDLASLASGPPLALTAPGQYAGTGTLTGNYGGKSATATLSVQIRVVDVDGGIPPNALAAFADGGTLPADPQLTSLLYPYDQTVFPLGQASPLLMWNAPNATGDIYRVQLQQGNYSYEGYFPAASPAQVRVPQVMWDRITASNMGDPLHLVVSRWNAATNTAYESVSQSWSVVRANLRGAIYYWAIQVNGSTANLTRIRPGTGTAPEPLSGSSCQGCHAVSADGTTLVTSVEGQPATDNPGDQRAWRSYDLPTMTQRYQATLFGGNVAVNPNGNYTVTSWAPLKLQDTTTGQYFADAGLSTVPLQGGMVGLGHPVFSPNGRRFAAVQSNNIWYQWTHGTLVLMDFDEASLTFSNPVNLVSYTQFDAGEQAVSYPSFSPDSEQLAFHVGDYASGCHDSCNASTTDTASLYMQRVDAPAQSPVRLVAAADALALASDRNHSYEPTFNPVERGGKFWVVFTSTRNWGNRIVGTPNNGKKRLWVSAIDIDAGVADPSHPAFFLEGQDETTMNMRGFWALSACTPTGDAGTPDAGACTAGYECCSGFCVSGYCVEVGQQECKSTASPCSASSECCSGLSCLDGSGGECFEGACTCQVPIQ